MQDGKPEEPKISLEWRWVSQYDVKESDFIRHLEPEGRSGIVVSDITL